MENKCNKTPNNSNNNNTTTNKYMDHVYCHQTQQQTKSSYNNNNNVTTAGGIGGGGGTAASPNADVLALLKENKQLKAMLILHLDLIQEQSDQLMAKEKALIKKNEELESMRARNTTLQNQVKDLQKQLQRQIKRSGEISTLPPPPLAKIQCQPVTTIATLAPTLAVTAAAANGAKVVRSTGKVGKSNIIGECNGKLISKIVLQRVSMSSLRRKHPNQSPQSHTTDSENDDDEEDEDDDEDPEDDEENEGEEDAGEEQVVENEEETKENQEKSIDQEDEDDESDHNDDIEDIDRHSQDSMDDKLISQPIVIDELYDTGNSTEDSNEVLAVQSKRLRLRQAAKQSLAVPRGAKPSVSPASTTTNDGQMTFKAVTSSASSSSTTTHHLSKQPPTPSRGKQMTIMRWHAPDYNTDESVSCDSAADNDRRSAYAPSSSTLKHAGGSHAADKKRSHESSSHMHMHRRHKVRRCTYISTPQLYSSREWEDEAFNCDNDYEFLKSEAKLLQADNPKLEIPKWTEHELTPSYCIEGTEDLSDEIFLKRHAKLEVDEKRRKKWDVQQIREQRRIERLKRRHCKDEIQPSQDSASLQTFYPTTDNLQTICFVHDLPVQAFGEMIPRLTAFAAGVSGGGVGERKHFMLPWLDKEHQQFLKDNNKQPTVTTVIISEATTSAQTQQQILHSSFILLKKRRRQQSSSFGLHHQLTSRQRNQQAAAAKLNNTSNAGALSLTANSGVAVTTTSAQTFLNIVSSTVPSSLALTPPVTTVAASQVVANTTSTTKSNLSM